MGLTEIINVFQETANRENRKITASVEGTEITFFPQPQTGVRIKKGVDNKPSEKVDLSGMDPLFEGSKFHPGDFKSFASLHLKSKFTSEDINSIGKASIWCPSSIVDGKRRVYTPRVTIELLVRSFLIAYLPRLKEIDHFEENVIAEILFDVIRNRNFNSLNSSQGVWLSDKHPKTISIAGLQKIWPAFCAKAIISPVSKISRESIFSFDKFVSIFNIENKRNRKYDLIENTKIPMISEVLYMFTGESFKSFKDNKNLEILFSSDYFSF